MTLSLSILEFTQYAGQALLELRDLSDSAPEYRDQRLVPRCLVKTVSHQIPSSSSVVAPDLAQTVATELALYEFAASDYWSGYYRKLKVKTLMLILEGSFSDSFQTGVGISIILHGYFYF